LVRVAYDTFKDDKSGLTSTQYPALASVSRDLFGICLVGVDGATYTAGDCDHAFTIMSVAKPFVFALVCDAIGVETARARVGVNSTGMPFNSAVPLELRRDRRTNPMVNPGALATTSLVPGDTTDAKWDFIVEGISRFLGHPLTVDADMYASASASNQRNRGIARIVESDGGLYFDAEPTTDLYTRQSCLKVTARDLAMMGATLADGGVNPVTKERVVNAQTCRAVLAVMATAGLYETTGDWLYAIGLPGKSGIGGGIVTVAPGKGGMGTFAPPLDSAGNSVKGQLVAKFLSEKLGLSLFASEPVSSAFLSNARGAPDA
jgi:glutaminase